MMKVIAAYLLAALGGNKEPTAEDIKDILGCVGAADDTDERIELLLSQVKGKDLAELIAYGREKLAVSGGVAPMEVNAVGNGGAVPDQKKEEKVEKKIDEETDDDMPFDIFGSDEE
ncbi:60S acidic ribosomal protein P2-4-like [Papaver somniferum]|uniref:60S acidic ribosomal protein P2-4-like n=1 Tax=Papaver somniferum TaxID=3469 RepID=UPI000E704C37|nr:60S acidic ribosomal protein P2-4-like [Papaver somniferum]